MKQKRILTTIIAVAGFAAAAYAQPSIMFYGFNSDAEAFQNVTWSPGGPGGPLVQTTHGGGGWQMLNTKEFSWGPGGGVANQQINMEQFAYDSYYGVADVFIDFQIKWDGASFPAGQQTWFQLNVVGNSPGTGWTQLEKLVEGWHPMDDATLGVKQVHLNFSQLRWNEYEDTLVAGVDANPGWFQLWIGSNSEGAVPVNFYIDNVVIYENTVPEPTSIALAGLGAALLMIRRRR